VDLVQEFSHLSAVSFTISEVPAAPDLKFRIGTSSASCPSQPKSSQQLFYLEIGSLETNGNAKSSRFSNHEPFAFELRNEKKLIKGSDAVMVRLSTLVFFVRSAGLAVCTSIPFSSRQ
jgi:hypothetical protein